ncbi:MAG: hypothetical protein LBR45_00710, partial [Bacteroidales bacterium]|nr:hypothetical protein [Bacteroidales bacterium]
IRTYRGCRHIASIWNPKIDGDELIYENFCKGNFLNDTLERKQLAKSISEYSRSIFGHQAAMEYELVLTRDYSGRNTNWFDDAYTNYSPIRYYADNFYENRLAFVIALNFPYIPWREKELLNGSRQQWNYYRIGDMFISRLPYEMSEPLLDAERALKRYVVENEMELSREELLRQVKKKERYQYLLDFMKAQLSADNYFRENFMYRTLDKKYEVALKDIKETLENLLESKETKKACKVLRNELGRDLTVDDLYMTIADSVPYPYANVTALKNDIPRILESTGFSDDEVLFILKNIEIIVSNDVNAYYYDALSGSKGHLFVSIDDTGVSSSSYRTAVYNMGCLIAKMLASGAIWGGMEKADYFMGNVPNESFAGGLGIYMLEKNNLISGFRFLSTMQYAGMALTEFYMWEQCYRSEITATGLRDSLQRISIDVWNKYFADVFTSKDDARLGANFSMLLEPLSTIGATFERINEIKAGAAISTAVSKSDKTLLMELYRIYKVGKVTPELWYRNVEGEGKRR